VHKIKIFICIETYFLKVFNQQQVVSLPEQPQVGSVLFSTPAIMPAAQPTPDFTNNACLGQFSIHAPHSMQ
jgi:hypothetical protein